MYASSSLNVRNGVISSSFEATQAIIAHVWTSPFIYTSVSDGRRNSVALPTWCNLSWNTSLRPLHTACRYMSSASLISGPFHCRNRISLSSITYPSDGPSEETGCAMELCPGSTCERRRLCSWCGARDGVFVTISASGDLDREFSDEPNFSVAMTVRILLLESCFSRCLRSWDGTASEAETELRLLV